MRRFVPPLLRPGWPDEARSAGLYRSQCSGSQCSERRPLRVLRAVGVSTPGAVRASGGFALISVPKPPAPLDPAHVREGYSLEGLRELLLQGCLEVIWHRYWVLLSPPAAMAGRRLALAARASRWRTPEPDAAVGRARVRLRGPLARHRASMGSRGPREETVSDYPDLDAHLTLERDAPPYRRG